MPAYRYPKPPSSEITPRGLYLNRRFFLKLGAAGAVGTLLPGTAGAASLAGKPSGFSTSEARTPFDDVTSYNNFYEFGTDQSDPARQAAGFATDGSWTIRISGECDAPGDLAVSQILASPDLEERVYRLRCVEGWSMVIPWIGLPLGPVLAACKPNSKAKFVAFETYHDPARMPGQNQAVLEWPYREGLRIDEAIHPLTLLAVGLYGQTLPPQNGAPVRLVVPWKYGFKSIKTIVGIRFQETVPPTSWNMSAPNEYGFYSNVNPEVDHPRWSQAKERRIGEFFRRETLMFNGYADQVAGLYQGMDLRANF